MDLRKRFFGFSADRDESGGVRTYVDELLDRLLLFDTYILDSIRFREMPALLDTFGFEGLAALLRDPSLEIHCDAIVIAYLSSETRTQSMPSDMVKVGPMHFGIASIDRELMLAGAYREFDKLSLRESQRNDLARLTADKLHPRSIEGMNAAFEQFKFDLDQNVPSVRAAATTALSNHLGFTVNPAQVDLTFHRDDLGAYEAITSISKTFGLSHEATAQIVGSAAVATTSVAHTFEKMRRFTCTVGGREREQPILEEKLQFLAATLNPEHQVQRFHRVLEALDLPRLDPTKIDLVRFLEIRRSRECQEFRDWLWSVDTIIDADLQDRLTALKSRIASWIRTDRGKAVRWAVGSAIGMVPIVGGVIGATLGALDSFVVERVLPESGLVTFLGQQYPSLFRDA